MLLSPCATSRMKTDTRGKQSGTDMLYRLLASVPEPRDVFRKTLSHCLSTNPHSARWLIALMALYLHLGAFSRNAIGQIGLKIDRLDAEASVVPLQAESTAALIAGARRSAAVTAPS